MGKQSKERKELVKAIAELDPNFDPKGWKVPGLKDKLEALKAQPAPITSEETEDDAGNGDSTKDEPKVDHGKLCLTKAFGKDQDSKLCEKCFKTQVDTYGACSDAIKAAGAAKKDKPLDPSTATVARGNRFVRFKGHVNPPKFNTFDQRVAWLTENSHVVVPFTATMDRLLIQGHTLQEMVDFIKALRDSEPDWKDHKEFRTKGSCKAFIKHRVNVVGLEVQVTGDHYKAVGLIGKKAGKFTVMEVEKAAPEEEKKAA